MSAVPSVPSLPAARHTQGEVPVVVAGGPPAHAPQSSLASLGVGVRWATLALGLVVAVLSGVATPTVAATALLLAAVAIWQADNRGRPATVATAIEVVLVVVTVVATGAWDSPFTFCLVGAVMTVAFSHGASPAAKVAAAAGAGVAGAHYLGADVLAVESARVGGPWTVLLLLAALLGGYVRRLFDQAQARHTLALDRMSELAEANELLVSLHRVAQTLPAAFDLEQVLASTIPRLRSLIDCDVVAVLLHDEATDSWTVAAAEGAVLPSTLTGPALPPPLAAATTSSVASLVVSLDPGEALGPEVLSRSGLYAPLRARGALLGLVALEQHEEGFYGRRELQILDAFVEPVALAVDNARWFARLRAIGAEEERVRIARDMHDSVGQSLAFVAFKLDRLAGMARGPKLREELDLLRTEVRGVLTEVRETLSDLRTEVTESRGLVEVLTQFLERVAGRAEFEVSFRHDAPQRLPLVQERELWRVAHEAVSNVERHARARHLRVRWTCDGERAVLTVADDGGGFDPADAVRPGSYGLQGMRERANAIGARLEIDSEPFVGTVVECRVDRADAP